MVSEGLQPRFHAPLRQDAIPGVSRARGCAAPAARSGVGEGAGLARELGTCV